MFLTRIKKKHRVLIIYEYNISLTNEFVLENSKHFCIYIWGKFVLKNLFIVIFVLNTVMVMESDLEYHRHLVMFVKFENLKISDKWILQLF